MAPPTPVVSFVVQCFNTERFVSDCINSILSQKGSYEWEIIAIDDYSSDRTVQVLESFGDPRLHIIRHEINQGHGPTIGEALQAARGRYVARIDSDDRYRPEFLATVLPIFERHGEVGLVYGDAALIDSAGRQNAERCDRQHGGRDFKGCELIELLQENFICAPTIIARRECFLRQLPVPSHLAFHDWYFTVKIAREVEFYYVDAVLADYRVHAGNMHSSIVLNRTEEPSIMWMLNHVYTSSERTDVLQRQKTKAKGRVYARQYLTLADKYFGAFMNSDARRCYARAIRHQPQFLIQRGVARRFAATLIGRSLYEECKRAWNMRRDLVEFESGERPRT
jgi:glycosyltransferase involved in cell wall biosynthesis